MIGRYFEGIGPDIITTGVCNYTQSLTMEALNYVYKRSKSNKPFFLYWAPDSTHGPCYSSTKFRNTSQRESSYG